MRSALQFFMVFKFLLLPTYAHADCNLEHPIQIFKSDLFSQRTVIRGIFENSPLEELDFILVAPQFGPLFNGKYLDHLSFSFIQKPTSLDDERFMRMSQLFDSSLFIKYETDVLDMRAYGVPDVIYSTIYIHRANPQPSPKHWTSAVNVTVDGNQITALTFWTPKDATLKERVTFCLKSGMLIEQTDRPPAGS